MPEISGRVREWFARRVEHARPIALDLKAAGLPGEIDWYNRHGFRTIASALASQAPVWSGETVTTETALNHSVVFTCKRILAESVGFLPLNMMQRKGDEKIEAVQHPMYAALHDAPNAEMTAQRFRETGTGHCVLGGNTYSQIFRRSGPSKTAYELNLLMPAQVRPDREKAGEMRLVYVVKDGNAAEKTYTVERNKPQDILHIPGIGWDGIRGYSVISLARHSIGTALAAERNVAGFYKRGGRLPYYLKLAKEFETDQEFEKFRSDWERIYAEPHLAPILEPFIEEYKQTGLSAVDAQLLETRQFSVPEMCRWFRISPHMAGDLSNANNSITEQLALEFVTFTLHPWLKRWEQELWRCVLTPEEKSQGYFWRHNVDALLRGAFLTRMQGYATALQNGWLNQNEVRDKEDLNRFEGGDEYHIQLNMQTLPTPAGGAEQQQQQPTNGGGSLIRLGSGKKYRRVA